VSSAPDSLVYGNWIRVRALWVLGALALGCLALAFAPLPVWIRLCGVVLAVGLSIAFGIPLYAYWAFSHQGGNVQERVYDTLVSALDAPSASNALDIGAGNGVLSVKLALAMPASHVTGIDSWGPAWEYAAETCNDNARRAGVADRVEFTSASAASLPFVADTFDAVASNLTFHEVIDEPDKRRLVGEALRVLGNGGRFAFIDLFYDASLYGNPSEFTTAVFAFGVQEAELVRLSDILPLPRLLLHPKVLGHAGVLFGAK